MVRTYAEPLNVGWALPTVLLLLNVGWALPTVLLAVVFKSAICVSPDRVSSVSPGREKQIFSKLTLHLPENRVTSYFVLQPLIDLGSLPNPEALFAGNARNLECFEQYCECMGPPSTCFYASLGGHPAEITSRVGDALAN